MVLELARETIRAGAHAIWRPEPPDGEWRIVVASGLSDGFRTTAMLDRRERERLQGPAVIEDVLADRLFTRRRQLFVEEGIRSLLAVPLRVHSSHTGALAFYSREKRRFSEQEIRAAMALANLAAAAMCTCEPAIGGDSQRRAAFLAQATALLGASLDYEANFAEVARLAVPLVGDWCAIEIREPDGSLRQIAAAGEEPAGGSQMYVPMMARGRELGAVRFASARPYGREDLDLAGHLAERGALAVDNALLFQAAQRERSRFRRLAASGIIGIVFGKDHGEDARIVEANDVFLQMLGYTREDLAGPGGLRWSDMTAPESAEADARAQEALLSQGACAPLEKVYIRKDGTRVQGIQGAAVLEPLPHLTWIAVVLDMTERKRLEDRLREAQKLESIGLLAGGIAHDFNNLLTGILGNVSLAADELGAEHPLYHVLDHVMHAAERAAGLTRELLAYSGKGRLAVQPVGLSKLVRDLSPLLKVSIPVNVELRLDLKKWLPPVEADAAQLQQLIVNLVVNGAEAIGDRAGAVIVSTKEVEVGAGYVRGAAAQEDLAPGTYVCLEVEDTGDGIGQETMARMFDPFFTTKSEGRGLGLAAALGIVRGHKGDIHVWSRQGQGSRFRVLLPAAEEPQTAPRPAAPVSHEALRGMGTVLMADDEDIILETGKRALEKYGYNVLTAHDGKEAVELFGRQPEAISLVLLDMSMPVMNGEEALRRMREIRPSVAAVVSTGYSELEAVRRFGNAGAAVLMKPYSGVQLADTVKKALEAKTAILS
ncbi:MAG: ATP-binding protein [Acidobacteriota bacterium]